MEVTVEQQTEDTRRAWSYNGAVDAGFEPQSYSWKDVPTGTWVARLDFCEIALHLTTRLHST